MSIIKSCLLLFLVFFSSRSKCSTILELYGEDLIIRMDKAILKATNNWRTGNDISSILFLCFPEDPNCPYVCQIDHKHNSIFESFILKCIVETFRKEHRIDWLIGITNRCLLVRIDEEIIFDECYESDYKLLWIEENKFK